MIPLISDSIWYLSFSDWLISLSTILSKQSGDRLMDIKNRRTGVRGEGGWGLGEKAKEIKQRKNNKYVNVA